MERGDPENLFLWYLMHEGVEEALNELPLDYRRAVNPVDINELSYEEAASVMKCPIAIKGIPWSPDARDCLAGFCRKGGPH